jgi:predicted RND superfamily exporter protein
MGFKITLILSTSAFALQIEAPPEITEQISAYVREAGAEGKNAILEAKVIKNTQCNAFALKLTDKHSGKTIKEVESCFADLPNATLQNAVFEVLGHPKINAENSQLSENTKTALIGIGFVAAGLLLYYSNPPKPVYGTPKLNEVQK